MIPLTPVERISEILVSAGYKPLAQPMTIAGVSFEVPAALVGTNHSTDLILVVDTTLEREQRILKRIEGVARALDVVKSRRPVTAVIAGPRPKTETLDALTRVCRVLAVGFAGVATDTTELHEWLAVLLPLKLPNPATLIADPLSEMKASIGDLPPMASDLVDSAASGVEAIQSSLHRMLESALNSEGFYGRS